MLPQMGPSFHIPQSILGWFDDKTSREKRKKKEKLHVKSLITPNRPSTGCMKHFLLSIVEVLQKRWNWLTMRSNFLSEIEQTEMTTMMMVMMMIVEVRGATRHQHTTTTSFCIECEWNNDASPPLSSLESVESGSTANYNSRNDKRQQH